MTDARTDELQTILHLSARSRSFLRRAGYTTVAQLLELGDRGLRLELALVAGGALYEIQARLEDLYEQVAGLSRPVPLEALSLSGRVQGALAKNGLYTVNGLARLTGQEIEALPGIGKKTAAEVRSRLDAYLAEHALPVMTLPPSLPPPTLADPALLTRAREQGIALDAIPIERLGVSRPWLDRLRRGGFRTVGELAHQHRDGWKGVAIVGWTMNRYLGWLVEQDGATWADEIAARGLSFLHRLRLERITLAAMVQGWLRLLDERQAQVVRWRHGLDGETLRFWEIGERLEISTQRAQQMHKQALKTLTEVQPEGPVDALKVWLVYTLEQAGGTLAEEEILARLCQEVYISQIEPAAAVRLLLDTADEVEREGTAWRLKA